MWAIDRFKRYGR